MTDPKDEAASEFEKFWDKVQKEYVNKTLTFKVLAQYAFQAGKASRELKLPTKLDTNWENFVQRSESPELNYNEGFNTCLDEIKALNECEGEGI